MKTTNLELKDKTMIIGFICFIFGMISIFFGTVILFYFGQFLATITTMVESTLFLIILYYVCNKYLKRKNEKQKT